jgi:hypothetical protein
LLRRSAAADGPRCCDVRAPSSVLPPLRRTGTCRVPGTIVRYEPAASLLRREHALAANETAANFSVSPENGRVPPFLRPGGAGGVSEKIFFFFAHRFRNRTSNVRGTCPHTYRTSQKPFATIGCFFRSHSNLFLHHLRIS